MVRFGLKLRNILLLFQDSRPLLYLLFFSTKDSFSRGVDKQKKHGSIRAKTEKKNNSKTKKIENQKKGKNKKHKKQ